VTLVDTNVLLDVITNDARWFEWSAQRLTSATSRGPLLINDVIYAELSVRYRTVDELDRVLSLTPVRREPMPREALFLAGKAFLRYRGHGGSRTGVLPDFFIGAHAVAAKLVLLTRDTQRFRSYFPTLVMIAPAA
jgi:predicted nucleic acid-binding protein